MYTANTMASAIEAMGMSLPYNSSIPAVDDEKDQEMQKLGKAIRYLMENNIRPRDIMTKKAFENAIRVVIVLGGSTNAVLHLMAMAHAADVPLTLDDFQRLSDETPYLADLKPSGQYVMEDLYRVGGVPGVMKYLLQHHLLHGDCLTVTGKTIAENLADVADLTTGQDVIHPLEEPLKKVVTYRSCMATLPKKEQWPKSREKKDFALPEMQKFMMENKQRSMPLVRIK